MQEELKTAQAELSNARAQSQAQLAVVHKDLKKVPIIDLTLLDALSAPLKTNGPGEPLL